MGSVVARLATTEAPYWKPDSFCKNSGYWSVVGSIKENPSIWGKKLRTAPHKKNTYIHLSNDNIFQQLLFILTIKLFSPIIWRMQFSHDDEIQMANIKYIKTKNKIKVKRPAGVFEAKNNGFRNRFAKKRKSSCCWWFDRLLFGKIVYIMYFLALNLRNLISSRLWLYFKSVIWWLK